MVRTRNYATVVYPESAIDNWQDILGTSCVPCFISPLHYLDKNPTGEDKKPHYHIMVMYDGVKTVEQVKEFFTSFGGVGCEVVQSARGYARYLCHLDNPEKAQYNTADVKQYGGADYASVIGLATDKYKAIGEMMDYCVENNILSYSQLLMVARLEHYDWFRILCDCGTVVMKEFLKSRKWELGYYYKEKWFYEIGFIVERVYIS